MDDELKNFMEETERAERQMRIAQLELQIADLQSQVAELRCIDTIFPGDIGAWLDEREIKLKIAARNLSDEAVSDIIEMMTTQFRVARKQLKRGDENNLKITVMTLNENWYKLTYNKGISFLGTQKSKSDKAHRARWCNRTELNPLLEALACMRDDWQDYLPVKDVWSLFFSELDKRELSPSDSSDSTIKDSDRITWDGNRRGMTYKRFRNAIGEFRAKNK